MAIKRLEYGNLLKMVGNEVSFHRHDSGMSQEELSELAHFHPTNLGRLERGKCDPSIISLSFIFLQLECLGVRIMPEGLVLIGNEGPVPPFLAVAAAVPPARMIELIARAIRGRRENMEMSLNHAAKDSGIHPNSLWNLESGLVCPRISTYYGILKTLGVEEVVLSENTPVLK